MSRWRSSDGLVEQTRRLFFALVLVSTALVQLRPLTTTRPVSPWLLAAAYVTLVGIWTARLVSRRAALVDGRPAPPWRRRLCATLPDFG